MYKRKLYIYSFHNNFVFCLYEPWKARLIRKEIKFMRRLGFCAVGIATIVAPVLAQPIRSETAGNPAHAVRSIAYSAASGFQSDVADPDGIRAERWNGTGAKSEGWTSEDTVRTGFFCTFGLGLGATLVARRRRRPL